MKRAVMEAIFNGTLENATLKQVFAFNILHSVCYPIQDTSTITLESVANFIQGGEAAYPPSLQETAKKLRRLRDELVWIESWSEADAAKDAETSFNAKLLKWEINQIQRTRAEAQIRSLYPQLQAWRPPQIEFKGLKVDEGAGFWGVVNNLKEDSQRVFRHYLNVKLPELAELAPIPFRPQDWKEKQVALARKNVSELESELNDWEENRKFWLQVIESIPEK